jgi:hypothetical protein
MGTGEGGTAGWQGRGRGEGEKGSAAMTDSR